VLDVYRRLLALRREDPVLRVAGREGLEVEAHGPALVVRRFSEEGERLLLVNLSPAPAPIGLEESFLAGRPRLFHHGPHVAGALGAFEAAIYGARA